MSEFLLEMFKGQDNRDASTKYNGYLFQDLVGIELLLEAEDDDELVMECIEDIVITNKSSIKIYQVKHYTSNNTINIEEITKDFFYQFLRTKLETEERLIEFRLVYAGRLSKKTCTITIDSANMVYKNLNEVKEEFLSYIDDNAEGKKKKEQEDFLFKRMATQENRKEFETKVKSVSDWTEEKPFIGDYREEIGEKIYHYLDKENIPINSLNLTLENLKEILLGAAIMFIQKSYRNTAISDRKIQKGNFINYLVELTKIRERNSEHIVFLILGYIDKLFAQYQEEETEKEIAKIYFKLYKSTKEYFNQFLISKKNRYRLINTISTENIEKRTYADYIQLTIEDEMNLFRERSGDLESFVRNVWKVMYDMGCNDFSRYIETTDEEYIRYSLSNEKNVIFLASANSGNQKYSLKNIFSRVSGWDTKPKGWYFRSKYIGTRLYAQDIKHIDTQELISNQNAIDITQIDSGDYFYLKCMNCIKVGDEIGKKDDCTCINTIKCQKGKF